MMDRTLLIGLVLCTLVAGGCQAKPDTHQNAAAAIFSLRKVNATTLSLQDTDYIITELWGRIGCNLQRCQCLSVNTLFSLLGADPDLGLNKTDLKRAAPVLLFYIHDVREACSTKFTDYTLSNFTNWLRLDDNEGDVIPEDSHSDEGNSHERGVRDSHSKEGHPPDYERKSHSEDEDHHEEGDDHKGESHSEDEDHHEEGDDHKGESHSEDEDHHEEGDDHKGESHSEDEDHHEDGDYHKGHSHSGHSKEQGHSHSEEVPTKKILSFRERLQGILNDLKINYSNEDSHEDTHSETHEDEHTYEGHDHSEEENTNDECFDAYTLLREAGIESNTVTDEQVQEVATRVILYVLQGYTIDRHCNPLPYRGEITESLLSTYGSGGGAPLTKAEFDQLLNKLKIGAVSKGQDTSHSEEGGEDGHDHSSRRKKRAVDDHGHSMPTPTSGSVQCLSASDFAAVYGFNLSEGISGSNLETLSPALVQQQVTGACLPQNLDPPKPVNPPTPAEVYGYGVLAVAIICLCALFGLVLVPCMSTPFYRDVMAVFIGLAVGSLIGDAFLHLFPAGYGLHGHEEDGHGHGDDIVLEPYLIKTMGILAALYFFFLFESIMGIITGRNEKESSGHSHIQEVPKRNPAADYTVTESGLQNNKSHDLEVAYKEDGQKGCVGKMKPVVLMVVLGDAVHNLADGLAIGAAFSFSVTGGLATSLAVFSHELPHELGDFAILIQSGLKFRYAALLNLISAATAFIGFFIGASLAEDPEVRSWIFVISGGMFIYIALVEMVPELVSSQLHAKTRCKRVRCLILQNIGIFIGVGLLLVIAIFEERIKL